MAPASRLPAANEPAPTDTLELIRAEQVAALYRNGPLGIVSTLLALCILVALLHFSAGLSPRIAALFIFAVMLNTALRAVLTQRFSSARHDPSVWRVWARRLAVSVLLAGLTIGVGACFLMVPERPELEFLVAITITGIASGVIIAWGSYLPVFFLSFYSLMAPPTIAVAMRGDLLHGALAALMLIYMGIGTAMARNYNKSFVESLRLRFENLALVDSLRQQKALAEQASLDKSRFLAAASHDLRQPVHALGMFVGALRRESVSPQARELIEHIDGSVSAMDDLFTSLLDISRLDAGIIESQPVTFALDPVLTRIARDLAPEAERKGLSFHVRPCAAHAHCDPLLLERVLRNLATNAVRYTDNGGVLLGVRTRGELLSIEVWDSGRGIPLDQQEQVFQEFYQLHNPERDRGKGLGLGLAIVQRLTRLLGCGLSLRSQPGRGSVFKVSVARASAAPTAAAPTAAAAPPNRRGGHIVVVDDEVAVRVAMERLLTSWGHSVEVGASAEEIIAARRVGAPVPGLIISDYRLRGGATGAAAITALRGHFGAEVPAMLVTGDTAPDRLREARASGFLLLHKPVSNGRLRAAVGNLLSQG